MQKTHEYGFTPESASQLIHQLVVIGEVPIGGHSVAETGGKTKAQRRTYGADGGA